MMKISIITVCFNSEKTIGKTLESVVNQTYNDFEHIIIDGGSTDRTLEIVNSYEKLYAGRLKVYSEKDNGIYDAMNKGITKATGDVIGIINSDDWYDQTALENVAKTHEKRECDMVVITGDLVRTTIDGEFLYLQKHNQKSLSLKALTKGMPLQHPAVFVSRKAYELMGNFNIRFRYVADWDFIWRCFASGKVEFLYTGTTVSYMREGGASDTFRMKNIWDRTKERYFLKIQYVNKRIAISTTVYFFMSELMKQFFKRSLPSPIKSIYYSQKHK